MAKTSFTDGGGGGGGGGKPGAGSGSFEGGGKSSLKAKSSFTEGGKATGGGRSSSVEKKVSFTGGGKASIDSEGGKSKRKSSGSNKVKSFKYLMSHHVFCPFLGAWWQQKPTFWLKTQNLTLFIVFPAFKDPKLRTAEVASFSYLCLSVLRSSILLLIYHSNAAFV